MAWWRGGLCCVLPLLSDQTDAGLSPRHRHHAGGADRQQNNRHKTLETDTYMLMAVWLTQMKIQFSKVKYTKSSNIYYKSRSTKNHDSTDHPHISTEEWKSLTPADRNVANVGPWLWWLYIAAPNLTFVPVLLCPVSLVRLGRPPQAPAAVLWTGDWNGWAEADM